MPFPGSSPPSSTSLLGLAPGAPGGTPPKAGPIGKLRQAGPKDTIPMTKTPRKQRSSRFHVTERVELEPLPGFLGESLVLIHEFGAGRAGEGEMRRDRRARGSVGRQLTRLFALCRGTGPRTTRSLPPEAPPVLSRVRLQRRFDRDWGEANQGGYVVGDARMDHDSTGRYY